jgi:hypothetical protein
MATKRAKGKTVKPGAPPVPSGRPKRGAPDSERIFAPDEDEPVPSAGRATTMKTRRKPDDEKGGDEGGIVMTLKTALTAELGRLVDLMEESMAEAGLHVTGIKFDLESSHGTQYVVAIEPRKSSD